jgi:hypothetical protein
MTKGLPDRTSGENEPVWKSRHRKSAGSGSPGTDPLPEEGIGDSVLAVGLEDNLLFE